MYHTEKECYGLFFTMAGDYVDPSKAKEYIKQKDWDSLYIHLEDILCGMVQDGAADCGENADELYDEQLKDARNSQKQFKEGWLEKRFDVKA